MKSSRIKFFLLSLLSLNLLSGVVYTSQLKGHKQGQGSTHADHEIPENLLTSFVEDMKFAVGYVINEAKVGTMSDAVGRDKHLASFYHDLYRGKYRPYRQKLKGRMKEFLGKEDHGKHTEADKKTIEAAQRVFYTTPKLKAIKDLLLAFKEADHAQNFDRFIQKADEMKKKHRFTLMAAFGMYPYMGQAYFDHAENSKDKKAISAYHNDEHKGHVKEYHDDIYQKHSRKNIQPATAGYDSGYESH